jgi:hypothetical protein
MNELPNTAGPAGGVSFQFGRAGPPASLSSRQLYDHHHPLGEIMSSNSWRRSVSAGQFRLSLKAYDREEMVRDTGFEPVTPTVSR